MSRAAIEAQAQMERDHLSWSLKITEKEYPSLFECLDIVSHDSGRGAGHLYHSIHPKWEFCLIHFEYALSRLSVEEREKFSIGEELEQQEICSNRPVLGVMSYMLDEWFNSKPENAVR